MIKFDPVAEVFSEYKTPTPDAGPHRLRVDSKGMIWFTETNGQAIGSIDPKTGKIIEHKIPLSYYEPYELWLDKRDERVIWSGDEINNVIGRFDLRTNKLTCYPLPMGPHWLVYKTEVEPNNTVWFGTGEGLQHIGAVHFYPEGYSASAPAMP